MSFPDSGILVFFDSLIKSNERQMWHSVENGFCRFKGSKYSRLLLLRSRMTPGVHYEPSVVRGEERIST